MRIADRKASFAVLGLVMGKSPWEICRDERNWDISAAAGDAGDVRMLLAAGGAEAAAVGGGESSPHSSNSMGGCVS